MESICASLVERLHHLPDQVGGGGGLGGALVEGGKSLLGKCGERLGICQAVALPAQVFVLARFQQRGLDLPGLEGEQLGAAFGIPLGGAQFFQFPANPREAQPGFAVGSQQGFIPGVAVEQAQVGADVQQREMLGLPVDVDQGLAQFLHQRQADGMPVDARHAASLAADLAREGDEVLLVEQVLAGQDLVGGGLFRAGQPEGALHTRQVRFAADGGGVGPASQEHVEGVHDDRLARPGLAGEHDQPRLEGEFELVDDGKVLDAEFAEHAIS